MVERKAELRTGRAGRPDLAGERFPCGKLKPRVTGAEVKRILEHAAQAARDRRFGSEVGRLLLAGKLTTDEAATAFAIGDIYGAYERFEGLRRAARSPAYEGGFGRSGPIESKEYLRAHAEAKSRFRFLAEILSEFPVRARTVIETLCVENLSIASGDPELMESLRALLQVIATALERHDGAEAKRVRDKRNTKARLSREERFATGAYAARSGDATPSAGAHRIEGSDAARDRAATVKRLEAGNARRARAAKGN
jgi:hypothetical protein